MREKKAKERGERAKEIAQSVSDCDVYDEGNAGEKFHTIFLGL